MYLTGNPIGSTDARDFVDNTETLDRFALSEESEYVDRLNVAHKTLAGMRLEVRTALDAVSYQILGDYAAGLVVQNFGQVFRKDGEFYRADAELVLPYELTGDWVAEADNFVSVGDAVLRQELADAADPAKGAGLLGYLGRTQADKNLDLVSVRDHGARADFDGTSGTDNALPMQAYVDLCETAGHPYMFIPGWDGDYMLNAPVRFHVGDFRIFGTSGTQFTHPFADGTSRTFRKGALVAASNVSEILNIGDNKTGSSGGNPARNMSGSWTIERLSLRSIGDKTTDGIALTGAQNGPDRPINIRNVSGYRLRNGIYMPPAPPGVTIQAATLNIEECGFSFGGKGVFLEGPVYGANISKSNFEGNESGCVHGNINGTLVLKSNMLENTKNPINIEPDGGLSLEAGGNYFESHATSDYLYRIRGAGTFYSYNINLTGDTYSGGIPAYPVMLTGAGRFRANVQGPVLITGVQPNRTLLIKNGSNLLGVNGNIAVKGLMGGGSVVSYVDGWQGRTDTQNEWRHNYPHDATKYTYAETPLGRMRVVDLVDGIRIDAGETIKDKLVINCVLLKCSADMPAINTNRQLAVRSTSGSWVDSPGAFVDYIASDISKGEWITVAIAWRPTANLQVFEFYVEEALRGRIQVAGVATKVIGEYAGDGSDPIKTFSPVCVNRPVFTATAEYDPPSLAAGAASSTTVAVPGAELGDRVEVSFSQPTGTEILPYGHVSESGTVTVVFRNLSGVAINMAGGTISVVVRR